MQYVIADCTSDAAAIYKKAELTPGLAHDRAATWRLTVNLDSSTAILTVQLMLPPGESIRTTTILARFHDPPLFDAPARGIPSEFLDETYSENRRDGATVR